MKIRVPILRTSFDIASWFLIRANSAGTEITHKKLQYLIYLAYGNYFIQDFQRKLIPVTFILSKIGPLEPNIYHLFKKIKLEGIGEKIPNNIEIFLLDIWKKFGMSSSNDLANIILENNIWKEISLQPIGSQIPEKLIVKSFVNELELNKGLCGPILEDGKEYWTLTGKKAERWIPGLSKKNK